MTETRTTYKSAEAATRICFDSFHIPLEEADWKNEETEREEEEEDEDEEDGVMEFEVIKRDDSTSLPVSPDEAPCALLALPLPAVALLLFSDPELDPVSDFRTLVLDPSCLSLEACSTADCTYL